MSWKATILIFFMMLNFWGFLMSCNARIIDENYRSVDSKTLFHKLGYDVAEYQKKNARLLREAPGGPDPHHHATPPQPPTIS